MKSPGQILRESKVREQELKAGVEGLEGRSEADRTHGFYRECILRFFRRSYTVYSRMAVYINRGLYNNG